MKRIILPITIATLLSTGCALDQVKQTAGDAWDSTTTFAKENSAVVGVVVGAALGYAVTGSSNRGLGVLAGAMAGGLIGNQIGKYLNESDRAELENYSLAQLNKNETDNTTTWKSTSTKAAAAVTTTESQFREKKVEIVKLKKVEIDPDMQLVGETYITKASMNVRYQPKVGDNKVGGLKKGAEFTAVGKTKNNWMLVAQNGITVGYVSAKDEYIQPAANQQTAMRAEGIDLDSLDDKVVSAGINLDGIDLDNVQVDKTEVLAKTECRQVSYDITADDGKNGQSSFDACRGADGAWELS